MHGEPVPPDRIDEHAAPGPRSDVAAVHIGGELVVHDPVRDTTHHLGPTATAVWRCLDGRTSLAGIAEDAAAIRGVERDAAMADLQRCVRRFARSGLLAGTTPAPATRDRPASAPPLLPVPPDE